MPAPGSGRPAIDRLLSRVRIDEQSGCWIYTGTITNWGYGHVWDEGRNRRVHRVTYEHFVGPIPEGLHLDHLCRVRHCCNPDHLEPVTPRENLLRGETRAAANAAKTLCRRGHPFDESNTYVDPTTGARDCRLCRVVRSNAYRARKRAAA